MKDGTVNQEKAHLLAVFLYLNQKLPNYVRVCQSNNKGTYSSFLEAAFDQTAENLEPKWKEYLKSIEANEEQIQALPPVDICENVVEFADLVKNASITLPDLQNDAIPSPQQNITGEDLVPELLKKQKPNTRSHFE